MNPKRAEMAELASRQHGLVSAAQLRDLGFTDGQRRHLLDSGVLRRRRRAVYVMAGVPPSREQSVLAAVLAAGPEAVVSHATAAWLWQLKHSERAGAADPGVHLTAPHQLRLDGVRSHRRTLPPGTRRTAQGIRVTSPEQTIVDLAGVLSEGQLGECLDDGLRRRLVRLDRLRMLVSALRGPGRRRILVLRRLLADRGAGYDPGDSDWERRMQREWRRLGLPAAVAQYPVEARGRKYRIDLAIPGLKIGIEFNGFETHGTRSGFDRDSDRRADLTAAGWHMLDFTTRSSPERIAGAVWATVEQRLQRWPLAAG